MTTATSFSNAHRSMYLGALRRNMPLGIFYGVLMTVMFPLMYIITLFTADRTIESGRMYSELQMSLFGLGTVYTGASAVAMVLICAVMPIVFGVVGFSFMHNKKSTDVYHALPLKRQGLFTANYLAGLTLLWIPIITSYVIILIAGAFNAGALGTMYSVARILSDMCIWLVSVSAAYTITATVVVLSGTGFDSVLYALALCGMYPVLLMLAKYTVEALLVGFVGNWTTGIMRESNMLSLSPFTLSIYRMASYSGTDDYMHGWLRGGYWFNLVAVFVWVAITVALFIIANQLYARRKSELAGCATPSSILSKIVQYALVFACGTIFGMILGDSFNSKFVYILGVLIGGGIAYVTYEAVVARGFKTFPKAFVQMGTSVGIAVAFVCIFLTGGLGFETRVPALADIQSVSIDYDGRYGPRVGYVVENNDKVVGEHTGYDQYYDNVLLASPEGIEIVRNFHAASVEEQRKMKYAKATDWSKFSNFHANITYVLKDGSKMSRSYRESAIEATKLLGSLENLDEFREQTNPAFLLEAGELKNIILANKLGKTTYASLTTAQQGGLIAALREDAKNETLSNLTEETYPTVGYVELVADMSKYTDGSWPEEGTYILITEGYTNTIKWLQENKLYEAVTVDKAKLLKAAVYKQNEYDSFRDFDSDSSFFTLTPAYNTAESASILSSESWLVVDNPALVQQMFEKSKNYGAITKGYYVYFPIEGGTASLRLVLAEEDVPPELKTLMDATAPWVLTEEHNEEYAEEYAKDVAEDVVAQPR